MRSHDLQALLSKWRSAVSGEGPLPARDIHFAKILSLILGVIGLVLANANVPAVPRRRHFPLLLDVVR